MIEEILLKYLKDAASVETYVGMPAKLPPRFWVIEKVGGGEENFLKHATVAIKSYEESEYEAAKLNELLKESMRQVVSLDSISGYELNSDYSFMDTVRKLPRYQAVFNFFYF
jgi:hypothetical protein